MATYSYAQVVSGDYYAYAGIERCDVTGTGGVTLEIDNAPARIGSDGVTPQPDRSHGGYVFYVTYQGASAPVLGVSCSFTSQSDYPQSSTASSCTTSQAGFTAAVNTASLSDPATGQANMPAGAFVEFGIDISTLLGIHPGCPGSAQASAYLRSFTGQSGGPGSNLKQYADPTPLQPPTTCVAPTIDTANSPGDQQIDGISATAQGVPQHDVATVTGTTAVPAPTGTVQFTLCGPGATDCATGGTAVGSPVTVTQHASNSTATSADVNTATAKLAPGKYCWRADFTPNPVNDSNPFTTASHTNSTTECFTIVHASPTIATTVQVTTPNGGIAGSLGLTAIGDSATLTGYAGTLTGQPVHFSLWGPYTSLAAATCTGTAAFTADGTLDAGGVATTSATFTPTAAGTYVWTATYPGDLLNSSATDACGVQQEAQAVVGASVIVKKLATNSTVNAGDTLGFDIQVENTSAVTATGVTVTDDLPTGPGADLVWTLGPNDPACSLSGAAGAQKVTCTFAQLAPGTSLTTIAHVSAVTAPSDCGTVSNTATLTTTNDGGSGTSTATVTVQCADLGITKTADALSVNVGSPIGFTVTVTNSGAGTAYGVDSKDNLPGGPGILWSIATPVSGCQITGPAGAQVLECMAATLASGASIAVHVTSPTSWTGGDTPVNSCGSAGGTATYDNTATVTATNVIGSKQATAAEQVLCPNLNVTKTADALSVNAGTQIGYTVTATNSGVGSATGVTVSDPLPMGPANSGINWTIDAANTSGPLTCAIASGALTCTGTLAAGQIESVHVISATQFASCATYVNTATLTASNDPQAPTATAPTTVQCADLAIVKTALDPAPVNVGSPISFQITVTNNGAGTANGVHVADPLPGGPGINWTLASPVSSCSITGTAPTQALDCSGITLGSGGVLTVVVTSTTQWTGSGESTVNSCLGGDGHGVYNNTATESWSNGPLLPISSNQATETVLCPALSFTKTADSSTVSAGSAIGFTITATNAGPGTATGAMINDPLPSGTDVNWTISPAYPGPGTCEVIGSPGAQTLSCNLGDLAADASVTVHISSTTSANTCGAFDNTATLTTSNVPSLTGQDTTTVQCPNVTLTKTADDPLSNGGNVTDGTPIGYTITVANSAAEGTGTATTLALNDPLPAGPAGATASWSIDPAYPGPGSCTISGAVGSQNLNCQFGDVGPDTTITVHVTSSTQFADCGPYNNTATVSGANLPNPLTASATTQVFCPALDGNLVKADLPSVSAGQPIGFTLSGGNAFQALQLLGRATHTAMVQLGTLRPMRMVQPLDLLPPLGTVLNAVLVSDLPSGNGVFWSISPAYSGLGTCAITGLAGAQVLTCPFGNLVPQSVFSLHITSATTLASCKSYSVTGTLTSDNVPPVVSSDTTTVLCPSLTLTKTADAAIVAPGTNIGFTMHATNSGAGTAFSATLSDPLPAGTAGGQADWTISPAYTGPGTCAITGAVGSQRLDCALGDLAPAAGMTVHVSAASSNAVCGDFNNTASFVATGMPAVTASAIESVVCAVSVGPRPTHTPAAGAVAPLASTGAGPITDEVALAVGLLLLGLMVSLAAVRRKGRQH